MGWWWVAVYLGQRLLPEGWDPRADAPPSDELSRAIAGLEAEIAREVHAHADHRAFIDRYCAMAA